MVMISPLIFAIIKIFFSYALADTHISGDIGFINDQKTISSRDIIQTTFYDASLYLQASPEYSLYLGFEYLYISNTQPNTATTTASLVSSNVMLGMKYVFGKKDFYSISLIGSPYIQANYQVTGLASDLWSGSAFASKFSLNPDLSTRVKLCVSLVYFSALYNSKSSSSGSTTINSFSRNLLMPTVGIQFNF
jgi:hypothetical protein